VTGNTVFRNHVLGIYLLAGSASPHSYLATAVVRHRRPRTRPG
jgi:hypothetical protein